MDILNYINSIYEYADELLYQERINTKKKSVEDELRQEIDNLKQSQRMLLEIITNKANNEHTHTMKDIIDLNNQENKHKETHDEETL